MLKQPVSYQREATHTLQEPRKGHVSSINILLLVLGLLISITQPASAHDFSVSHFSLETKGTKLHVSFDLDGVTAAALLALDSDGSRTLEKEEVNAGKKEFLSYLDGRLIFANADEEPDGWRLCSPGDSLQDLATDSARISFKRAYKCSGAIDRLLVQNTLFMEDLGGHLFVADVALGEDEAHLSFSQSLSTFVLRQGGSPFVKSMSSPLLKITNAAEIDSGTRHKGVATLIVFQEYLQQGMLHIWGGIDHVLFVISLLLVVRTWRELGLLITSFTLAHSLTLILGALNLVSLERWLGSAFVESSIALSILYVALENLWLARRQEHEMSSGQPQRRLILTFLFGLLHGFGFSSVLREFGLPSVDLVPALLAFNLGVELGQLMIVLPLFPLLLSLSKRPSRLIFMVRLSSALIACIALLWFIERAFGLGYMPI